MTDQIEFANVIVLNKTDLVNKDHLGILKAAIHKLNPSARILKSSFSKIEAKEILNTGLFNFEEAEQSAGWIEELNKEDHTPETEEYGIGSFVYRSKKPFDPKRFWHYVQHNFPHNIIRSKGMFWIASRPEQALIWGQAEGSLRADSAGVWWSSMPIQKRLNYVAFIENQKQIESGWDQNFGDRQNEIVIIGQDLDKEKIISELNDCIASETELATDKWRDGYADEWPVERVHALN